MDLDVMAEALARTAADGTSTIQSVDEARAALVTLGVPDLIERLQLAERILRAGSGFHLISRFFVDGSDEQRYLLDLEATQR